MKYTGVGGAVCACLSRKLGVRRTHEVSSEFNSTFSKVGV